jgi:hypothetical protein
MRVGRGDSLVEILRAAFDRAAGAGGPVLVDCPVDYSQNERLTSDLREDLGHILPCLSSPKE